MICHAFSILFNPIAYQITKSCSSGYVVETSDSPKRKVTMDISLHDQQCMYMLKIKITRHERYAAHHKHLMAEPLVVKTDFFFLDLRLILIRSESSTSVALFLVMPVFMCVNSLTTRRNTVVHVYNRSRLYVYS